MQRFITLGHLGILPGCPLRMGQLGPGTQGIEHHLGASRDSPRMFTEDGTTWTWDARYRASPRGILGLSQDVLWGQDNSDLVSSITLGHLRILPGCPLRMEQLGPGTQGIEHHLGTSRDSPRMSPEDGTRTWDTGYQASPQDISGFSQDVHWGRDNSDLGRRVTSITSGHLGILPGCPLRMGQLGPGTQGIEHHISGFSQDVHWGWDNSDLGHRVSSIISGHLWILLGCPLRMGQLGPGTQGIEHHISGFPQDVHWGRNNSDLGRRVSSITSQDSPRMSTEDRTTRTWDAGYRASPSDISWILPGCPLRTEQLGPGMHGIEHHLGRSQDSPRMSPKDKTAWTWDAWYIQQTSQGMSPYGWDNLTQIWVVDSWFSQDFQGSEQLRSGTQGISSVTLGHFVIILGCSSKAKGHFVIPRISP